MGDSVRTYNKIVIPTDQELDGLSVEQLHALRDQITAAVDVINQDICAYEAGESCGHMATAEWVRKARSARGVFLRRRCAINDKIKHKSIDEKIRHLEGRRMWMGFDEYEQTMRELLNEKDALREKSSVRDYRRSKRALNRAFAFVMTAERVLSPETVEEIWKSAKEWYPENFQSSDWASIKAIKEKDALQEDEQTGSAGQELAMDLAS